MSFELIAPDAPTGDELWDDLKNFIRISKISKSEGVLNEVKTFIEEYPKTESEETEDHINKLNNLISIVYEHENFFLNGDYINDFVHEALEANNGFIAEKLLERVGTVMQSYVFPHVILKEIVEFRHRACFDALLSLVFSDAMQYDVPGNPITYLVELFFHIHSDENYESDETLKYMDVKTSRRLLSGWHIDDVLQTIVDESYYDDDNYDVGESMESSLEDEYYWNVEKVNDLSVCKKSEKKTSKRNVKGEVIMESVMDDDPITMRQVEHPAYFISSTDERGRVVNTCYNKETILELAKGDAPVILPPTMKQKRFKKPPHADLPV